MADSALGPLITEDNYKTLNGLRYHYLKAEPRGEYKGTAVLLHGWPDLSAGWKNQVPAFTALGFRVIAPDLPGFGRTEAPKDLDRYSLKNVSDDIKELTRQLGVSKIVLGGHDWGGVLAYRVYMWYPSLISHLISVCIPFFPPDKSAFLSYEEFVEKFPNFRYQMQFASGEVEKHVNSRETIAAFINGVFGGKTPDGERVYSAETGIYFDRLPAIGPSPLFNKKELEYYVNEYDRKGLHSPMNWYRTREINHKDELSLDVNQVNIPLLYIAASRDVALPPALSKGMEQFVPNLSRGEVNTSHWALLEAPGEVNQLITDFLQKQFFGRAGGSNL